MSSRDPSADTPDAAGVDVPLADPERVALPRPGRWLGRPEQCRPACRTQPRTAQRRALLATNQPHGFDCPGCAWGDANAESSFAFCENGAKAVAWEVTAKRVTR